MTQHDPLEALFHSAMTHAAQRKASTKRPSSTDVLNKKLSQIEDRLDQVIKNPENWRQTRTLLLIHRDSDTLLGVFEERVHKTVEGLRRLTRIEAPVDMATLTAKEFVEGPQWLPHDTAMPFSPRSWHETREVCCDIHLDRLGLSSLGVVLKVTINTDINGLEEARLTAPTRFATSSRHDFLFLPTGLNILHDMSTETKLRVRLEMGI